MLTVKAPGHPLSYQAAFGFTPEAFEAEVRATDNREIVTLRTPAMSLMWSAEQWAAVIPALVAQLPVEQRAKVIAAINSAEVVE